MINAPRDDLDYESDGAAVKVNSIARQDALGYSRRYPNWAFAWKGGAL